MMTSLYHFTTSPVYQFQEWKSYISSSQNQLQQLQINKWYLLSFIFQKPITAVTWWQEKFFVLLKPSYSGYRIISKQFSFIFSKPVTAVTGWQEKFLCSSQTQLQWLQNHTKKIVFDLFKPSYSSYRMTWKQKFFVIFWKPVTAVTGWQEKISFIFSKPVTAVLGSHQKNLFDLFKASYSSSRITSKKFLSFKPHLSLHFAPNW